MERSRVDRRERADRILDTARDLLLLWGYRRVTIDELARRAGVGKGTIYLHWRSREEVFHAVSTREAAAMADAIVQAIRDDPAEVALHRYLRRLFVEAMNRPVLRALYTRDADTLDTFLASANHHRLEESKLGVSRDYLGVLAARPCCVRTCTWRISTTPCPRSCSDSLRQSRFCRRLSGLSLRAEGRSTRRHGAPGI